LRVRFADFVLDRATRQLLKAGEVRALEPKAFALLDLLIRRRPAAVSKTDIRDALWPATFVSESSVSSLMSQVRRALGSGTEEPRFLRTVHGFGYAFDAEAVEEALSHSALRAGAQIEWERGILPLMEGENLIGRGEEMGVRIDVDGVSRRHARILAQGGRFTLEDLGSKNGTYLGDRRLDGPAALTDGDALRLGRTKLVFTIRQSGEPTATED
jgi:DNA-binding winged helix-turn-helix (wHTH) protein